MDQRLFERALKLLSLREHSVAELRSKLSVKCFDRERVEEVLEMCKKSGYVDDVRFAEVFVESLRKKGKGVMVIKMQLENKGVDRDIITTALKEVESGELESALAAARKKNKTLVRCSPKERKEKLSRFLSRRGFSFDVVSMAINRGSAGDDCV